MTLILDDGVVFAGTRRVAHHHGGKTSFFIDYITDFKALIQVQCGSIHSLRQVDELRECCT